MLNTEYRLYDPRLAQWLTRDPVFQPWESPYSAMAGNPILFSDPQGDTPGTEHTPQAEAEGGGGGQKDKIVNYGPPNEKVDKYAKILAKHTSETPAYSQPDISICEPVNLVFRGNFLTVDNYDVVTKDGIVGSIGIGEFRWGERFALFHAERPEGVEVLQQIETGFNYNGIIITRQYSEAALLAHEPPVPSWLPSSSNQARINQPGQYNGKIPKTSANQASPPPAAKQKTDQSAGSAKGIGELGGGGESSIVGDFVRVRHHTSREGLSGIKSSGSINASRIKPYGVDVEVEPFIKPTEVNMGQFGSGSYVEFSIPRSQISPIPGYMGGAGTPGRIITGGLPLNIQNASPKFIRFNWLPF